MKLLFVCFTMFIVLGSPVGSRAGLFDSEVDKAKEFIAVKMYPQAIAILEKEINDSPTNAEAHYQLGICYISKGDFNRAEERFASAVVLDTEYGNQIGGEWQAAGTQELRKGNISSAEHLFRKAVSYQPSLKSEISGALSTKGYDEAKNGQESSAVQAISSAIDFDSGAKSVITQKIYALGEAALKTDDLKTAGVCFSILGRLDSSYNVQIADLYFQLGTQSVPKSMFLLFDMSQKIHPEMKTRIADHLVMLAKTGTLPDSDEKLVKNEAKRYLGKAEYEKEFPIVWTQVGPTHTFKGEGLETKVYSLECLVDFKKGDKIVIEGNFMVKDSDGWKSPDNNGKYTLTARLNKKNSFIIIKAPKDELVRMAVLQQM